jgi:hypothetical protein
MTAKILEWLFGEEKMNSSNGKLLEITIIFTLQEQHHLSLLSTIYTMKIVVN